MRETRILLRCPFCDWYVTEPPVEISTESDGDVATIRVTQRSALPTVVEHMVSEHPNESASLMWLAALGDVT